MPLPKNFALDYFPVPLPEQDREMNEEFLISPVNCRSRTGKNEQTNQLSVISPDQLPEQDRRRKLIVLKKQVQANEENFHEDGCANNASLRYASLFLFFEKMELIIQLIYNEI